MSALRQLKLHEAGDAAWRSIQRAAVNATRNAISAIDAVLSQFEDLPEALLDALVGAVNESRQLLTQIERGAPSKAPGVGPGVTARYQTVVDSLQQLKS
jgi:hypothetical protein